MSTAIIATVLNENRDIHAFLASIEKQTRTPDLVVIVDGGSSDGTWGKLQVWDWGDLISFIAQKPGNRSVGRNEAIRIAAEHGAEIIACTNVSVLDPEWLERIAEPIEYGDVDVVGGSYRIHTYGWRERIAGAVTQYNQKEAESVGFVTALSMAFTTEAWRNVGRFPEELDTSEDTVFVQRLRDAACKFAHAPMAMVDWHPSTLTLRGAYRTYKQFADTDRKAGVKHRQYTVTFFIYYGSLVAAILGFGSFALFSVAVWLLWRSRKAQFLGIPYVIAVDAGRIGGYFFS